MNAAEQATAEAIGHLVGHYQDMVATAYAERAAAVQRAEAAEADARRWRRQATVRLGLFLSVLLVLVAVTS